MTQALEFLYFVTTKEITFAKLGVCCESAMIGEFHPHASDSGGGACPSVDASNEGPTAADACRQPARSGGCWWTSQCPRIGPCGRRDVARELR